MKKALDIIVGPMFAMVGAVNIYAGIMICINKEA